jgi:hypothetical protein
MIRAIAIDLTALNHRCQLSVAGAICQLDTNSEALREALRGWCATELDTSSQEFSMRLLVSGGQGADVGRPHFRGRNHLVIASFGEDNVFVFDLLRRQVTGVVSEITAADQAFLERILLPIAIGVLGPAVGVVPVHAACLVIDGMGVLISGASGAGKSTLSVAMAQGGFAYVSDDWTYLTVNHGRLLAHGMRVPAKLLPDALTYFPVLAQHQVGIALNLEPAYELPLQRLGAVVESCCDPQWFFFLERTSEPGCALLPVSAHEARRYVERSIERLPPELTTMMETRAPVVEQISHLSCWKLTYGGPPSVAVSALQKFFAEQRQGVLA